ncbi:universal stress protein [Lentilactobacillus sp. SPB1-3]|uniref:Universal stress protein n=1 Tax=Lentilactobacillus terminaliae TaxID=3003483 RepID=A0ACD5DGL6_9LACO|nr:universal stress protein [Lentilactobacillus sp. SPB1-3]MCZ0977018.1 universal stress protein [Lentilactobacillus sp. SPB1-3]
MANFNYSNVVVGVDGSKASGLAFKKALQIATNNHARLVIVAVINERNLVRINKEASVGFGAISPRTIETLKIDVEARVSNYVQIAKDAGIEAIGTVDYGDPRDILTDKIVEDYGADLLVVGATGAGPVTRLMMGSTATYVVSHAPVDVIVVRTELANK